MNRSYDCEFYTARTRKGSPRIRTFEQKPYSSEPFFIADHRSGYNREVNVTGRKVDAFLVFFLIFYYYNSLRSRFAFACVRALTHSAGVTR